MCLKHIHFQHPWCRYHFTSAPKIQNTFLEGLDRKTCNVFQICFTQVNLDFNCYFKKTIYHSFVKVKSRWIHFFNCEKMYSIYCGVFILKFVLISFIQKSTRMTLMDHRDSFAVQIVRSKFIQIFEFYALEIRGNENRIMF